MIDSKKYLSLVQDVTYKITSRYFNTNVPPNIVTFEGLRNYLGDMLIKLNINLGENLLNKIDEILQYELLRIPVYDYKTFITYKDWPISLWKGDITTLKIDCIVNAANSKGLGCFFPSHRCIDNVIHRRASPRLRDECRSIMQSRKKQMLTSELIITKGYNLPCKYVFHTVGPIYGTDPSPEKLLARCYLNCLEKAKNMVLTSIAFCCISTGEYGFPKKRAATIALTSVKKWWLNKMKLLNRNYPLKVVFCVFTDEDKKMYGKLIPKVFDN